MLDLESAIKHCEEVAKEKESEAQDLEYFKLDWRCEANQCSESANEHRQLSKWLKELKAVKQIIVQHDSDHMPEDYWYIDKIREVVREVEDDN